MSKSLITLLLVLASLSSFAQQWREVDSLRSALQKSATDTGRINTLLRLAESQILKPGERKADLDSGALYLEAAKKMAPGVPSSEITGHLLLVEAYLWNERGQRQESQVLVTHAIRFLNKGTNQDLLGHAWLLSSQYFDDNDAVGMAHKLAALQSAANAFNAAGNIEREAYVYQQFGELTDPFDLSMKRLRRSLALYQSIHYKKLQAVYDAIGADYIAIADYRHALEYQLMALKAAAATQDSSMRLCEINNHIGITYYKLFEYANSATYFHAALRTATAHKDTSTIYLLTQNICDDEMSLKHPQAVLDILHQTLDKYPLPKTDAANDLRFTNHFLRAYTLLKQYSLAERYSEHLLYIVDHHAIPKFYLSDTYVALINYFFASRQYGKQLVYLKKNDTLTRQLGLASNIIVNNKAWFKLDTTQHNYRSALLHHLAYVQVYDSIYTLEKNKQIQQLKIEYETKDKENQIALLNQKTALQQSNLDRTNLVENVTLAGIVLVLVIAGLLYRQSALRKKTNQVVTRQNALITQKNELLQSLVTEKEWLLKEVHHRVKNNLHSVICLLEAQAAYLENDALEALENSQHRIYTMSLIHQKLYQSDDVRTIDMATYLPELVQYLRDSFNTGGQIHFNIDIAPIQLHAAQAIPLGLIINEALTNSIKYAFPGARRGMINISLDEYQGMYKLELADNGIGMAKSATGGHKSALGMELMKGLAKEIRGTIRFETHGGVKIIICFEQDVLHPADVLQDDYLASA